jgi:hypothetical protein
VEQEICLVYPGTILTFGEAKQLEEASGCDDVHRDANRYVAEIPNTSVFMDQSGRQNLNPTGSNLYVDGLKYADPRSPLWAPGPTVNHERVLFAKLEPHHSETANLRGFWLQRKKGETITKGEPLFWNYDCGAGKFDLDFGLAGKPPPFGWKPSLGRKRPLLEAFPLSN